jgi:hypothetical protein
MSGARSGRITGGDRAPVTPAPAGPVGPAGPAPGTVVAGASAPPEGSATVIATTSPNPAPAQAALAVFIFREIIAVLFVGGWLLLFAGELITGKYEVPFWFHIVGVGVMAYALGINVAELTAFRPPTAASVLARNP